MMDVVVNVETVVASHVPEAARPRARRHGASFWLCAAWLVVVSLAALTAPHLPIDDPSIAVSGPLEAPSAEHWFGTDQLGRDVFSRIVHGGRVSLVVGFAAVAIGLVLGTALGIVAGYRRGALDAVIVVVLDILLALPALIVILAVVAVRGAELTNITLSIGALSIAPIARVVRASTMTVASADFVLSARAIGTRAGRIVTHEVLPNVIQPALQFAFVGVGLAILAEGSLSFFGLSVRPPTPTWGGMINEARLSMRTTPLALLWPTSMMLLTVLSLNGIGEQLGAGRRARVSLL